MKNESMDRPKELDQYICLIYDGVGLGLQIMMTLPSILDIK